MYWYPRWWSVYSIGTDGFLVFYAPLATGDLGSVIGVPLPWNGTLLPEKSNGIWGSNIPCFVCIVEIDAARFGIKGWNDHSGSRSCCFSCCIRHWIWASRRLVILRASTTNETASCNSLDIFAGFWLLATMFSPLNFLLWLLACSDFGSSGYPWQRRRSESSVMMLVLSAFNFRMLSWRLKQRYSDREYQTANLSSKVNTRWDGISETVTTLLKRARRCFFLSWRFPCNA